MVVVIQGQFLNLNRRIIIEVIVSEKIFNIKIYHATVISNQNVATFIKELVLKLDQGESLDFTAGAYVQIDIPRLSLFALCPI